MQENFSIQIPASPRQTPLYFGEALLTHLPELLKKHAPAHRYALITDSTVETLHGKALAQQLKSAGLDLTLLSFPAGESSKNEATKQQLDHELLKRGFGRDTVLLALGGGVVGDMVGFVAATYLRGIPFVQIPTTVLAMVDSSIGGKVGVDTPFGKNLIGAFWHPNLIVADTDTLSTLSEEQKQNGFFEVLKMALCLDMEANSIERAMQLKAKIVSADERESAQRAVLNFGHTVGHALELLSDYRLLHGFAVGLGMWVEARISCFLGHLSPADFKEVEARLIAHGTDLSVLQQYDPNAVWDAMQSDKKNREGKVKMVLLAGLGKVVDDGGFTHPVSKEDFLSSFKI